MKTKIKFKLLTMVLGMLCIAYSNGFAQPSGFALLKDTSTFRKLLLKEANETRTIQSDFIQEKNLSVLSEKIITKGHFYFKRENMLRWEYTEPFKYLIILNKNKVLVKDETKENKYDMASNKMFQQINKMMVNSMQGKILNTGEFKYRFFQNEKFYLIEMLPQVKNMKEFIKTIFLYVDKSNNGVSKIEILEPSGDYTNIAFANRKENVEIPDEKFNIK